MSLERDYNESGVDNLAMLSIVEGLSVAFDWHIQKVKNEIRIRYVSEDIDVDYIEICIDEINKEVLEILKNKIECHTRLIKEKIKDESTD